MGSKGSILIIDDDTEFQTLSTLILGGQGYEIIAAENGQAALDILSTQTPALIVLDLRMPSMNGVDFLKAYHAMSVQPVPVIMVSAGSAVPISLAQDMPNIGTFLSKPFSPSALRNAVAEYLS